MNMLIYHIHKSATKDSSKAQLPSWSEYYLGRAWPLDQLDIPASPKKIIKYFNFFNKDTVIIS